MIIILISNDMAFKWHLNVLFHCHGLDSCGYTGELGFCADHPERSRKHRWITLSFVGSIRPIGNIGGLLTFIKLLGSDFLPWNSTWTVLILIGGLEHLDYFSIYWECHHPIWLSYFSEWWLNHQPVYFTYRAGHRRGCFFQSSTACHPSSAGCGWGMKNTPTG